MLDLLTDPGQRMHELATRLFPLNRSLTGEGIRESLKILQEAMPDMTLTEVPSGTQVNDWVVPEEWWITEASIQTLDGRTLVDFADCNLHVVGYSESVDAVMSREELEPHLHSLPSQPNAIPYITSYYERRWGFCLSENQRQALGHGPFRVRINAGHVDGSLTYGEVLIPGDLEDEVFLSSYLCHPSMANNELSGPVVMAAVYQWLEARPKLKYSYRMFLGPETIGAIAYLAKHQDVLKSRVRAGWVLTCLGGPGDYWFIPSRFGNSLADQVSVEVLKSRHPRFSNCSFQERGSDERQWCSPNVDLPICSITKTKYAEYPEYHTSLDDLAFVTAGSLSSSFDTLCAVLNHLEDEPRWRSTVDGEPQFGRRGLYRSLSSTRNDSETSGSQSNPLSIERMSRVLAYCDGSTTVDSIATYAQLSRLKTEETLHALHSVGLVTQS